MSTTVLPLRDARSLRICIYLPTDDPVPVKFFETIVLVRHWQRWYLKSDAGAMEL